MASTVESITAQLRELIDNANSTTGNADDNVTDCINELIKRYRPTGSMDGLENGYDVMFYDENNEGLAFVSVTQGQSINAPIHTVTYWMDKDNNSIDFPYTPTSDIVLYAFLESLEDKMYTYYSVSKTDYPYLVISYISSSKSFQCRFAKSVNVTSTSLVFTNVKFAYKTLSAELTDINASALVDTCISNLSASSFSDMDSSSIGGNTSMYLATNFDVSDTMSKAGVYSLV